MLRARTSRSNTAGRTTDTIAWMPSRLVRKAAVIAILINPDNPNGQAYASDLEPIARAAGQRVLVLSASNEQELDAAFAILVTNRADAVVVAPDPFFDSQ